MRKSFPGYYRPSEAEFSRLWADCWFVLDANVLLNLYRYSEGTRNELFGILEEVSDRLWVPHQAAWEYQRSRLDVIEGQKAAYEKIRDLLVSTQNSLTEGVHSAARPGRHPFIRAEELLEKVRDAFAEIQGELDDLDSAHPDLLAEDPIREAITELLDGKVGTKYCGDRLEEIYKEGKLRYDQQIPPGYLDAGKGGTRQYGDLVLWLQVIDQARETEKPIVMVTDDRKEDWWLRFKGRTISPRPELVEEMTTEAGVSFYMYPADPFMEHAGKQLERRVESKAIDEVRDLRERDEEELRARHAEIVRRVSQDARRRLAEADDELSRVYERRMREAQLPTDYRWPVLTDFYGGIVQQMRSEYTPDQWEEFRRRTTSPWIDLGVDFEEFKRRLDEQTRYSLGLSDPSIHIPRRMADAPQAGHDSRLDSASQAAPEDERDQAAATDAESEETED